MIKLVALDLDHTLLGADSTISQRNKAAVAQVLERGMGVVICTGRMYRSSLPFAQELGLSGPLLCYNGALVMDIETGQELYHEPMEQELAAEILALAKAEGIHANLYYQDQVYYAQRTPEAEFYENQVKLKGELVGDLLAFLPGAPTKILFVMEPEKVQAMWKSLGPKYEGRLNLTVSESRYLEFLPLRVNKGKALSRLMEQLGLSKEEVMAVGDSYNDLELLQTAGLSVAMGNAPQAVKDVASYVTHSNLEDGVAEALHKFILAS